jgi:hypothetical protein
MRPAGRQITMTLCDGCGNTSESTFTVQTRDDRVFAFDSVECALPFIAPTCAECCCLVLGHGIHVADRVFCCSNCADRAEDRKQMHNHIRPAV